MNSKIFLFLFIVLTSCTEPTLESSREQQSQGEISISVVDSIAFDLNGNYTTGSVLLDSLNIGIWSHTTFKNSIVRNNLDGSFRSIIDLPTINEPYGLNRISSFHAYNEDSIFVYDAQFLKLLLVNGAGDIQNFWNLKDIWKNGANFGLGKIVSIAKNDRKELIVEISGFEDYLQYSSKIFYELSTFLHQINLTNETVELQGLKYPENSPFRKQLYWTGNFPDIIKSEDKYLVSYSLDPNMYLYNEGMEIIKEFDYASKRFPQTSGGGAFPSPQERNIARITRKLNGFSLGLKSTFVMNGHEYLIRVYREALGNNDDIPDDMAAFMRGDYPENFYLQLFRVDMENATLIKIGDDLLISDRNIGNFFGKGKDGYLYFLSNNPKIETPHIVKVDLKIID